MCCCWGSSAWRVWRALCQPTLAAGSSLADSLMTNLSHRLNRVTAEFRKTRLCRVQKNQVIYSYSRVQSNQVIYSYSRVKKNQVMYSYSRVQKNPVMYSYKLQQSSENQVTYSYSRVRKNQVMYSYNRVQKNQYSVLFIPARNVPVQNIETKTRGLGTHYLKF